ncbi:MAG: cysteine desulfurase [Lentisphaerae bacterium]|nr:MAG: cysteine desulfurase [Lentisphaerota bacterium]
MKCDFQTCACVRLETDKIRHEFPILHEPVRRGQQLIYFDNGATTQKPRSVIDRITHYYLYENANIHRGVHWLSEKATLAYEMTRETVRNFINARDAREIVYVRGTTEGINLVANSFLLPKLKEDDEILISAMEHHSNIVPWQMLCEKTGAKLKVIPMDQDGVLQLDQLDELLTPRTKLLSIVHISNVLGTINPIREMIRKAHDAGVPVLVDAAQSIAHVPIDVQELDCDFLAFSAHKMYGPTGIGVLYGKAEHLEAMVPYQGGGDMIRSVTFEKTIYNDIPYKFEAGTPNIAGVMGMGAAVEFLQRFGITLIAGHETDLLQYATLKMKSFDFIRIIGNAPQKAAVISFLIDGVHPHDIAHELDLAGVAIRAGHHCAQPVMDFFAIPATARATFALYNTREEVDHFVDQLPRIYAKFKR